MKFDSRSQLALMIQDALGQTGGERGRESEAEVETVNFYRKEDEGTADPFPPCVSPSGKKTPKTKDMKRT